LFVVPNLRKTKEKANMLHTWLGAIHNRLAKLDAEDDGPNTGACMLPDPNGGPPICEQLDQTTCKNLGGTFVGGDC
jgi:hypothetical protein